MDKNVIELLKTCSRLGVRTLKLESIGLEVVFSEELKEIKVPVKKLTPELEIKSAEAARLEAVRERELRLAQMDLEDPHAYEQMLLSNSEKEFVDGQQENIRTQ